MISNQVLQNTLEGLKEISRTEFCIIDTDGKVLASTFNDFSFEQTDIQAFAESQADSQLVKGYQYFKVSDDYQLEYILVVHGEDEDTYMVGKLAAFQLQSLTVAYKERFDKETRDNDDQRQARILRDSRVQDLPNGLGKAGKACIKNDHGDDQGGHVLCPSVTEGVAPVRFFSGKTGPDDGDHGRTSVRKVVHRIQRYGDAMG